MVSNTIIFITGANTGLGFETAKSLCQSPNTYTILLGGRSIDKANAAVKDLQTSFPDSPSTLAAVQVDIEDDKSIEQAFQHISSNFGYLDVLINNAGMIAENFWQNLKQLTTHTGGQFDQQLYAGKMTMREMWNKSWDVNTTGTHILTHTLVPLLLKSSNPRLLFIASGTSSLTDSVNIALPLDQSPPKGWPKEPRSIAVPAYRSSKTGMNMMMRHWARILKEDGVKVWCISPGYLATGLGVGKELNKSFGAIDPSIGANFVRDVVEGARDQDVGKVIRRNDVQPW
jgi:NAD(P)-dependent dehydrogenase (short-subunit alcohol dehydrogenase family)